MSRQPNEQELLELLEALCRDELDDERWDRLESILIADPQARAMYRRYINSHIGLKQYLAVHGSDAPPVPTSGSPVLGWLGSGAQGAMGYLWRATPFSLLVAIGLPLLCILIVVTQIQQPERLVKTPAPEHLVQVATLRRTVDCQWPEGTVAPSVGETLAGGRRVELTQGLAEIAMNDGATIIVEGPASLVLDSGQRVAMRTGKLTAQVPQRARGFTVCAPGVSIVDLGTEFGVAVEDGTGHADVEVFRGEVRLESQATSGRRHVVRERLTAGQAVRVEPASFQGKMIVREIASSTTRFVREMPKTDEPTGPAVVADFSGGDGVASPDQFPGVAGVGWASPWSLEPTNNEVDVVATVENTRPLRGGGDYLRVLATRVSGVEHVRRSLQRRADLDGPVDMKKPHVVSFDLRVDELGAFDEAFDALTICNNSEMDRELTSAPSGGWHIRISGGQSNGVPTRKWKFCDGNGRGQSRVIDSGIMARQGDVYSFRVFVDPEARRWTPSIAVNDGPFRKYGSYGMRSSGTAQDRGYWPFLHFRWEIKGGSRGQDTERIGFSLDSLRVVPADKHGSPLSGSPAAST